jgi:hypothetical protein
MSVTPRPQTIIFVDDQKKATISRSFCFIGSCSRHRCDVLVLIIIIGTVQETTVVPVVAVLHGAL